MQHQDVSSNEKGAGSGSLFLKPQPRWRKLLSSFGPGVVTGAADDDPSGIVTYSIAGAQFGTALLWLSWITWPLMASVQAMCARIGMVTGHGLARALAEKFPRPLVLVACVLLFAANTINIGSDLAGMADAAELLTGLNSHWFVILFGAGIGYSLVYFRYRRIADVLKWLALALFAYVITAFMLKPDWASIAEATFAPPMPHGKEMWQTIVAILGTTISPYLFFWQSSQEVEEEKSAGRYKRVLRIGATAEELSERRFDVGVGTFFSNAAMFFIILTTALTLHKHGMTDVQTSAQIASALEPFAGKLATLVYAVGIIGVGLLAIPTLAGSAAYAFSDIFKWKFGLDERFHKARAFYIVLLLATCIGIGMDFTSIDPIRALFWTAIINGLLAPFLMVGILLIARDTKIMHGQPCTKLNFYTVTVATVLMFAAGGVMLVM